MAAACLNTSSPDGETLRADASPVTLTQVELALEGAERTACMLNLVSEAVLVDIADGARREIKPAWLRQYRIYAVTEDQDAALCEAIRRVTGSLDELREVFDRFADAEAGS